MMVKSVFRTELYIYTAPYSYSVSGSRDVKFGREMAKNRQTLVILFDFFALGPLQVSESNGSVFFPS
jgi:hypothetical protein